MFHQLDYVGLPSNDGSDEDFNSNTSFLLFNYKVSLAHLAKQLLSKN